MSTKKYTIRMGNPCTYGWENMTPADKGRHCAQCDKVVTDFTTMSDAELIDFLLKNKNICGHFNRSQLNRPMVVEGPKRFKFPHWPAIAAMLVAGLFQLNQGNLNAQANHPKQICATEPNQEVNPNKQVSNKTEPANYSLITIGIKVIDSKTKAPLHAGVTVHGISILANDKIGCYTLELNLKDLPKEVLVEVGAGNHQYFSQFVSVAALRKSPYYLVELVWESPEVDGGDFYIEREH